MWKIGSLKHLSPWFLTLAEWARLSTKFAAIAIYNMVSGCRARLAAVLRAPLSTGFLNMILFTLVSGYRAPLTTVWWARLSTGLLYARASVRRVRLYNFCCHGAPHYGDCLSDSGCNGVWSWACRCKGGFAFYRAFHFRDLHCDEWLMVLARDSVGSLALYSFAAMVFLIMTSGF